MSLRLEILELFAEASRLRSKKFCPRGLELWHPSPLPKIQDLEKEYTIAREAIDRAIRERRDNELVRDNSFSVRRPYKRKRRKYVRPRRTRYRPPETRRLEKRNWKAGVSAEIREIRENLRDDPRYIRWEHSLPNNYIRLDLRK